MRSPINTPFAALPLVSALLGAALVGGGCPAPPTAPSGDAGGSDDAGTALDGGTHSLADAGDAPDAGDDAGSAVVDSGWTWLPVEGSKCASGSTAGIGVNLSDTSDDLLIYVQGGGACWNQGTCVPSLLRYGPICYYNPNFCLYDGPGGVKPMSSHVTHPDPFPADGTGVFPSELALIASVRAFDRDDEDNPFKDATFVYVPYCTGDLHTGDAVRTYPYKYDAFGAEQEYTFHFAGATNMELYLDQLVSTHAGAEHVWLTGSSAGGYGATFNFERVKQHFPSAEVSLLGDSSPFVDTTVHWQEWRDEWNMQLPADCADCDEGFSQVMTHVIEHNPDERIGLLAFDSDAVIRFFFYGGTGPEAALSPPSAAYTSELAELEALYDANANAQYFVLPSDEHVMWGGYGTRKADGSFTEPRLGADGETSLKAWIDAWASGDASWTSVAP